MRVKIARSEASRLDCAAIVALVMMTVASVTRADSPSVSSDEGFYDMSLEELMDVEIVSASRHKQKLMDVAMPASIVTAEDNRCSGLTKLYEILQFAPSIDALQVDRNRYALGVRGLHDAWSDRTLRLINDRVAAPAFQTDPSVARLWPFRYGVGPLRVSVFLSDLRQHYRGDTRLR